MSKKSLADFFKPSTFIDAQFSNQGAKVVFSGTDAEALALLKSHNRTLLGSKRVDMYVEWELTRR